MAKIWLWPGAHASWHFISLPKDLSATLREKYKGLHHGWNSLKVHVGIGGTAWDTSMFYSTQSNAYILPIKAQVRKREQLYVDDEVMVEVTIV